MDKRILAAAGVLTTVFALHTVSAQNKPAQHVTPADAVKFNPLDPKQPDGFAMSVVSGDPQSKGPLTILLRLPKGKSPLHTHTAGYHGVLVSGQAKHWAEGGEAKAVTLAPGSVWYQPGKAAHGDECLSAKCVLLLQLDGPFDFAPVTK
jgi:hypothetical protein